MYHGHVGEMQDEEDVGPTFDDLAIDDTLADLDRVKKYVYSNIALQRLVHVRMLADTVKKEEFSVLQIHILPLLENLVSDVEFVVRQHLAGQFQLLAEFCAKEGGPQGYRVIIETLLPLLARLVADAQAEVRVAAGETLVAVAQHILRKDLGAHVLTIVLQLAHDEENEDLRMTAAVLLNELAERLGKELCHQFVTPEIISLSEDPVFRVRKATALNIDRVCHTAGPDYTMRKLLPAYLRLSQDDIWGVRKACAESLVEVSKSVSEAVRASLLIEVFERFAADSSKWVRNAAFQHLGPFIAALSSEKVSPALLSYYLQMASSSTSNQMTAHGSELGDNELTLFCAFSFPAVCLTLGKERWGELRGCYQNLERDMMWKVRRTLSHSLHEIAKILGPSLAEKELLSSFDLFMRDLDEVKVGILTHISDFMSALSPECREKYLSTFVDIKNSSTYLNWRFREILASQLAQLCVLFSYTSLCNILIPLSFDFFNDSVHAVREASIPCIPIIVKLVNENNKISKSAEGLDDLMKRLSSLCKSNTFSDRVLFIRICISYLSAPECDVDCFSSYLLTPLLSLHKDKVSNVRCLLARCFAEAPSWLASLPEVITIAEQLCVDVDVDVRWFVGCHQQTSFREKYLEKERDGSVGLAEQKRVERKLSVLAEIDIAKERASSGSFTALSPIPSSLVDDVVPLPLSKKLTLGIRGNIDGDFLG